MKSCKETLCILFLLLLITISNISNITPIVFILKVIIIVVTFFISQFKFDFRNILKNYSNLKYYFFLTLIAAITTIYSSNYSYGILKLLNLILNIPILILLTDFIRNINENKAIQIMKILLPFTIISFILVILIQPFDQSKLYVFDLTRWSHVLFSRMLSLLFLVLLVIFLYSNTKRRQFYIALILFLVLFQIYYANLRAATIGIIIFSFIIIIYAKIMNHLNYTKIKFLLLVFLSTIIMIYFFPTSSYFNARYTEPAQIFYGKLPNDGGMNARFQAYQKAIEVIYNNPIMGVGFGGFNNYNNDDLLSWIIYPHNIFLEFQVEMGIIGSLFFLFYLGKMWRFLSSLNKYILFIWLFTLWLALFAKDIPSNLIVFLPVVLDDNSFRTLKD